MLIRKKLTFILSQDRSSCSIAKAAAKAAFTLAEVLITLAIIGVVAAIVMPTLISNYKKQVTVTALRKTYSTFAQALQMAEAEYGEVQTWPLSSSDDKKYSGAETVVTFLKPYLKISKVCMPASDECWTEPVSLTGNKIFLGNLENRVSIVLENGQSALLWTHSLGTHIQIWVDIDGPNKGDAKIGKDVFGFVMSWVDDDLYRDKKDSNMLYITGNEIKGITLDTLKNETRYGCSLAATLEDGLYAGVYCGALISNNGWKIPDDYPLKF